MNRYLYPTFKRPPGPEPGQIWQRKDKKHHPVKLLRYENPSEKFSNGRWMINESEWIFPDMLRDFYEPI